MPAGPQTINSFQAFLKEEYLSSWVDQLNSMTTTFKLMRRKLVSFGGKKMIIPIRTGRNPGVGAVPTSNTAAFGGTGAGGLSTLITAGQQGIQQSFVVPRMEQAAIEVAQDAIDMSAGDRAAFYNVIDFEMMGVVQDAPEDMDRQMYGNGNGTLTFITDAATSATHTVGYGRTLAAGMSVDIWSSGASGATLVSQANVIISVTPDPAGTAAATVVFTSSFVGTTTQTITRTGVRTATVGFEFMGLDGIVDSANPPLEVLQGIDRSTAGNDYWKATEDATAYTGVLFKDTSLQQNLDTAHDISNGDIKLLLMNRVTRAKLYNNMQGTLTRFTDTNMINPGLLSGKLEDQRPDNRDWLFFDGRLPIVVDKYCQINTPTFGTLSSRLGACYGIDTDSTYMGLVTDWKWWDGGQGTILRPSTSRKFGLEAVLYLLGNLVTDSPNKNFKITTITV